MKKVNKKGFVLAETITVSVVVITVLVVIYAQFANIDNSYYRSLSYDNVNDLYLTNQIKELISKTDKNLIYNEINDDNLFLDITDCKNYLTEYMYCENLIKAMDAKKVIITKRDTTNLINKIDNYDFSETMKNYIKNGKSKEEGYRIIVEYNSGKVAGLVISNDKELEKPSFTTKTIGEIGVTIAYTTTEDANKIKETICYYGKTEDNLNNKATLIEGGCSYPINAAYAKVCLVSNSGVESCSDVKQLAEYLILDGEMLVDFQTSGANIAKNDGYITLTTTTPMDRRQGMYIKKDLTNYAYLYLELDAKLEAVNSGYSPSFIISVSPEERIPVGDSNFDVHIEKGLLDGITVSKGWSKTLEKTTTFLNVDNANKEAFLTIWRNYTDAILTSNIYNVWLIIK